MEVGKGQSGEVVNHGRGYSWGTQAGRELRTVGGYGDGAVGVGPLATHLISVATYVLLKRALCCSDTRPRRWRGLHNFAS